MAMATTMCCQPPVSPPKRDRAHMASFLNTIQPCSANTRMSPTFSGAVTWLKRHKYELSTALRLVQVYPNVIQDEAVDCLWDFMQPFLESLVQATGRGHRRRSKRYSPGSSSEEETSSSTRSINVDVRRGSLPAIASVRVYFCHQRPDGTDSLELAKVDILERALLPFCYIRDCSSPYAPWLPSRRETIMSITDSDVFVFSLNDETLSDMDCLEMLYKAHKCNIPIVMIRDPGYNLPETFPDIVTSFHPKNYKRTSKKCKDKAKESKTISEEPERKKKTKDVIKDDTGMPSPKRRKSADTLIDLFKKGSEDAIVYVLDFHEACIGKLYDKLTSYVGPGVFPNNDLMKNNRNKLQFIGMDYVKSDGLVDSIGDITKEGSATIVLKAVNSARMGLLPSKQLPTNMGMMSLRRLDSRIRVYSAGELAHNTRKFNNEGRIKSKAITELPPLNSTCTIDGNHRISQKSAGGTSESSDDHGEDDKDDDSQSIYSFKETAYLLFKRAGETPDVVRWPIKGGPRRRDSLFLPLTDDESDISLKVEAYISDIDIHSEFSTPEPEDYI